MLSAVTKSPLTLPRCCQNIGPKSLRIAPGRGRRVLVVSHSVRQRYLAWARAMIKEFTTKSSLLPHWFGCPNKREPSRRDSPATSSTPICSPGMVASGNQKLPFPSHSESSGREVAKAPSKYCRFFGCSFPPYDGWRLVQKVAAISLFR